MKVGLVQINNSFSGQNYYPLSVGTLQAYALKHLKNPSNYEFLVPVYSRIRVDEAVERLSGADLVGFSSYVWNFQISLRIAEKLKKKFPSIMVVFGGPHVPDNETEAFLRKYPFIDIACHGEGEKVFTDLLENVESNWSGIPSISYLDKTGHMIQNKRIPRMRELSDIPSPYLEGIFDSLMRENPDENWIAMWETNRGCPFSCSYCDWGSATAAKVSKWELDRLFREVEWFADHKIEYIFCADANFGIFPRDIEIAQYCADIKAKRGYPKAISIQATKNAQERSYTVQKILADAGLNKAVVISMQSMDQNALKSIRRDNISLDAFKEIQRRFTAEGVETMSDLILALPGETYDSFVNGLSTLIGLGQHNRIQFNNLSILPNAEMGDPKYIEKYGLQTIESEVVNIHGTLPKSEDDILETQQLVIATDSLPKEDWVKVRAICWMTGLLHFDKILQIPIIVVHSLTGISYRELLESFLDIGKEFPILSEIRDFFFNEARKIQKGGVEFKHAPDWLNIYWPHDEYVFIQLSVERKLPDFYKEAEKVFHDLLKKQAMDLPEGVVSDAIQLNQKLIKQPFIEEDAEVGVSYNVKEIYRAALVGKKMNLEYGCRKYRIDRTSERWTSWEQWYREVVWWGNRKGAYLYGNICKDIELEGHY